MAEEKMEVADGVLRALVYRATAHRVVYLESRGGHPDLNLDADISLGGDWDEAMVYRESAPPMPPKELGLWEMELPWRHAVAPSDEDRADPNYNCCEDETLHGEICCIFIAKPTWIKRFSPDVLPRVDVAATLAENARLKTDNAHLREEKRLVWEKTNAPLGTCHDAEL